MRAQRMRRHFFVMQRLYQVPRSNSNPAANLVCVAVERGAELPAHLGFFEWDMGPTCGCKDKKRNCEHRQRSHPECDPKRDDHKTQIHGIARETEWAADDERLVCL